MKVVHCCRANFDIYIGRKHPKFPQGSKWGNPFVIGKDGTREDVIVKYEEYVRNKPELMEALPELENKMLSCWCAPKACHGDVLIRLLGEIQNEH